MSIVICHDVIDEITEAAEANGQTLVGWVMSLPEIGCEYGPMGWRLMPCGCLVVERLEDAIANIGATQEYLTCAELEARYEYSATSEKTHA